jgi:hypothetical protein
MTANKLTIIKVIGKNGDYVTAKELEEWREIFANHRMSEEEAIDTGEVSIEHIDQSDDGDYITFVKIGDDTYKPTPKDLEDWRDIFEDATNDPDFKIFTHPGVEVKSIPVGKIIAVK